MVNPMGNIKKMSIGNKSNVTSKLDEEINIKYWSGKLMNVSL